MVLVGSIGQDLASHVQEAGVSAVAISGRDGCTLGADGRRIPVTGMHDGFVGQDQQSIDDRTEDGWLVAIATPRGAGATAKQRVARHHQTRVAIMKATAAG